MVGVKLLAADLALSFAWVWAGVLAKMFIAKVLCLGNNEPLGEFMRCVMAILYMFLFSYLGKITRGGAYNPLTVLSSAISGDFTQFLLTVGARIPIQVLGSIYGVRLLVKTFPEVGLGPRLNVNIHHGALTEGLLTYAIIMISLGLARNIPGSFYMKTWISSVSKLALQILGSDLTGGCMNPAAVMGWAYARGDHITKEHILVYWLAPVEATLLAVWTFKLVVRPLEEKKKESKTKHVNYAS